jgi:hypothetical protein
MNRGDLREDIFRDDQDRQKFLSTLGVAWGKTDRAERAKLKSCQVGGLALRTVIGGRTGNMTRGLSGHHRERLSLSVPGRRL